MSLRWGGRKRVWCLMFFCFLPLLLPALSHILRSRRLSLLVLIDLWRSGRSRIEKNPSDDNLGSDKFYFCFVVGPSLSYFYFPSLPFSPEDKCADWLGTLQLRFVGFIYFATCHGL
ncbi:hypothetical protein I7I48_01257 [Histoplasma ohiense]|nr:hypothetical protein I7I48_01257 [Histoplasma ohiense (nom. inval.)]